MTYTEIDAEEAREQNSLFLEVFKDLEKLCNEIYRQDHGGVSRYIEDLESCLTKLYEPSFSADLKELKNIRRKRNQLAHEAPWDAPLATQADIDFAVTFREKIFARTDPLAVYRKKKEEAQKRQQQTPKKPPAETAANAAPPVNDPAGYIPVGNRRTPRQSQSIGCATMLLGILLLIALVVVFLIHLS